MDEAGNRPEQGGILIIDDDPVSQLVLKEILASFTAARVQVAADGPEGLAIARMECPEIILLDYRMPGISGLELIDSAVDASDLDGYQISGPIGRQISV